MSQKKPTVLLVEADADLREVNAEILAGAGYDVNFLPNEADPIAEATRRQPDVVVINVGGNQPDQPDIVDRFHANPATQSIPIVVLSTSQRAAAQAKAAPNVPEAIVAPYDISALDDAVARALKLPPSAAVLPPTVQTPPAVVAQELNRRAREITLAAVAELRQVEPWQSRFQELSPSLVDHLGMILGAITDGVARQLSPSQVFSVPEISNVLAQHVVLRKRQHFRLTACLREYQALRDQVTVFLQGLVGHDDFDASLAESTVQSLQSYFAEAIRIAIRQYGVR